MSEQEDNGGGAESDNAEVGIDVEVKFHIGLVPPPRLKEMVYSFLPTGFNTSCLGSRWNFYENVS